jgi:glycolate oxidase iron-sulfur subunit
MAAANITAFAGYDLVVADAAGCSAHLAGYAHWGEGGDLLAARTRDATVVVAELIAAGRLPELPGDRGEVGVQDPCHLRHAQRVTAEPRRILTAAGYRTVEIDPAGMCCGAAGIYMVTHPGTSDELGCRKADQVRDAGVLLVASANPGCEMQLRTHLGREVRIAHPIELYHEALTNP